MRHMILLAPALVLTACGAPQMDPIEASDTEEAAPEDQGPADPEDQAELEHGHADSSGVPDDEGSFVDVPVVPPTISLGWAALGSAVEEQLDPGDAFLLRVENVSDVAVDLQLMAVVDDGKMVAAGITLDSVQLEVGEATEITVDPRRAGIEFASMMVSGRIHVNAFIEREDGGSPPLAVSPALFFHPTDGQVSIYGEEVLQRRYAGGDYLGRFARPPQDEDVDLPSRIIVGGPGIPSDVPPLAE